MSRIFARKGAAVVGAAALALALAACSPPNEQPSDLKVDTATEFVAAPSRATSSTSTPVDPASLPGVIECVGSPELRPGSLALTCADANDRLIDITWDEWTATSASGTATRETNDCDPDCARGTFGKTRGVEVELSEPVRSPQGLVFTRLVVDGDVIVL